MELGRHQELNGKLLEAHDVYAAALAGVSRESGAQPGRGAPGRPAQALRRGHRAAVRGGGAEEQRRRGPLLPWSRTARRRRDPGGPLRLGPGRDAAGLARRVAAAARTPRRPRGRRPAPGSTARPGGTHGISRDASRGRNGGRRCCVARARPRMPDRAFATGRRWTRRAPSCGTRPSCSEARTTALWAHLASDPERVLELAVDYMALGLWEDAHALLARRYPATGVVAEPGTVLPQDYPLVAYYRGYCAEKMGRSGRDDFALASRQSTRYVFPNRPESLVVLRRGGGDDSRGRHGSLPARLAPPLGRADGRGARRVGKGARPRSATPGAPPQHRLHAALRARRGGRGPARLRGGDGRGPHERRALPGRRSGPEPPRPRSRGPDRRPAPLPGGVPCPRRSSTSWPWPSPKRDASRRRRRSSPGASSRARSSGRTCARSTWR